jgi:hypothetical protein
VEKYNARSVEKGYS